MEIKLGDRISQRMGGLGIDNDQIRVIIENPDRINVFDLNLLDKNLVGTMPSSNNMLVSMYSKSFESENGEYYVWLLTTKPETGPTMVMDGYKLNANLLPGIEDMSPIEIIEKVSEKFGIPFTVDGEERTSIVIRHLVLKEKNILPIYEAKPTVGHDVVVLFFLKIHPNGKTAIVALKYTMDLTKYDEWFYVSKL